MSVTVASPSSVPMPFTTARTGAIAGGVLGVLGALTVFAWSFLNWDDSAREVVTGPGQVIGCLVAAVGALLLTLTLSRVLPGLAPWAVTATVAGLAFVVVDAWYNGTVAVAVANEFDDATYDTVVRSGWAFLFSLPKMLLCLVGFVGLAISGYRTGRISRPLCVLLAVAGFASVVPPFMPGMVVGGLALALVARSARD